MHENVSELFSAARGNVELAMNILGQSVYTSDKLKSSYLKAMRKAGKTNPVIDKLEDMVQKKILIPVYSTNKLLKSLVKLQPLELKGFAGVVTTDRRILIFVETEANIFSFTSNDALATVTLHELIHYMAAYHLNTFYQIFKNTLEEFYGFYYLKYLNGLAKNLKAQKLTNFVKFINFKLEPNAFQLSNNDLKNYYNIIVDTFKETSSLEEKEFVRKVSDIIVLIKVLQKLVASGSTQYMTQVVMAKKEVVNPIYVAYKTMLKINPLKAKQLCFQELWSTSEVISISTMIKTPSPKVYQAIKKL